MGDGAGDLHRWRALHLLATRRGSALETVYPVLVRIGETLPAASLFQEILGLKTLLFSFSTADEQLHAPNDEQLHAPNEFFRLSRLDEGMRAWAELWLLLATGDSD